MRTKRWLLIAAVVLLVGTAARADQIDFNFLGSDGDVPPGTWAWAGGAGSMLTADAKEVDVKEVGMFANHEITGSETLSYTTGGFTGGAGTPASPFVFGAGGTITVTGDVGSGEMTLFSGTFTDVQTAVNASGPTLHFDGFAISGLLSDSVNLALGLPSCGHAECAVFGSINDILMNHGPGHGQNVSGDLVLTSQNVPEPATLGLFGMGLVGMAALRRKLFS